MSRSDEATPGVLASTIGSSPCILLVLSTFEFRTILYFFAAYLSFIPFFLIRIAPLENQSIKHLSFLPDLASQQVFWPSSPKPQLGLVTWIILSPGIFWALLPLSYVRFCLWLVDVLRTWPSRGSAFISQLVAESLTLMLGSFNKHIHQAVMAILDILPGIEVVVCVDDKTARRNRHW